MLATFCVPEERTATLKVGQTMRVRFAAQSQLVDGTIEAISPVTDAESGTVRLQLLLENSDHQHRAGERCTLELSPLVTAGRGSTPRSAGPRRSTPMATVTRSHPLWCSLPAARQGRRQTRDRRLSENWEPTSRAYQQARRLQAAALLELVLQLQQAGTLEHAAAQLVRSLQAFLSARQVGGRLVAPAGKTVSAAGRVRCAGV